MVQLSYPYMTTWKTIALTVQTFVSKVMPLLFNTLSKFIIAFLPRSKHLFISWLQLLFTVILEPKKIESVSFHFFPIYLPWWWDWMPWSQFFECCILIQFFYLPQEVFSSSLSAFRVVSSAYLKLLIFLLAILWFQLVLHRAWHFAWCTLDRS